MATEGEVRLATALPFLIGGGLGIIVSVDLFNTSRHVGSLPLWPLVVGLSLTSLMAGLLLLVAEPDEEEDADPPPNTATHDHVLVPKEEWARIQAELKGASQSAPPAADDSSKVPVPRPLPSKGAKTPVSTPRPSAEPPSGVSQSE